MFYKAHSPLGNFLAGWASMVDAIVKIGSLGFFGTNFETSVIFWSATRMNMKMIKRKVKEQL